MPVSRLPSLFRPLLARTMCYIVAGHTTRMWPRSWYRKRNKNRANSRLLLDSASSSSTASAVSFASAYQCCLCPQRGATGCLLDEDDIYDSVRRAQKPLVNSLSGGAGNGASETILEGYLYKRECWAGKGAGFTSMKSRFLSPRNSVVRDSSTKCGFGRVLRALTVTFGVRLFDP